MSDNETIDRSGAMDAPVAEAKRSPDGMAVLAELRARVTSMKNDAEKQSKRFRNECSHACSEDYASQEWAFKRVLLVIDELSGCQPARTGKAWTPHA
jgi:integron integrase